MNDLDATSPVFRALCVCTGNVCRSPVAERLLRSVWGSSIDVCSAGTHAPIGASLAPMMATLLDQRGITADDFAARRITVPMLRGTDLVLVMTVAQRGLVVDLCPAVVRRVFTMKEFARLLKDADPAALPPGPAELRLRRAVTLAASRRSYRARPEDDDVVDPQGRSAEAHRVAFTEIAEAVDTVSSFLSSRASLDRP